MPSPLAHSLTGYIFYDKNPFLFFERGWTNFLFYIFLCNLPDIDFLPGLLMGEPNRFHHGFSHTLGAAFLVALIAGIIFHLWKEKFWAVTIVTFFSYYSHVFMDYFTEDFRLPFGVMLLWPFDSTYYISKVLIFKKVFRSDLSSTFFSTFFSRANIETFVWEAFIMGVIIILFKIFRHKHN